MRLRLYAASRAGLQALLEAMASSREMTLHDWPADARILALHVHPTTDELLIRVESETFAEIVPHAVLPVFPLVISAAGSAEVRVR